MARPRRSGVAKGQQALQKLAEAMGGTLDMSSLMEMKQESDIRVNNKVNPEAEFVLQILHKYHSSMMKKCKRKKCGEIFQTDYCHNNYCSDLCLAADLKEMGLTWDPFEKKRWEHVVSPKDNLRYRYEPPQVISTQTLNELEEFARSLLADLSRLRDQAHQQMLENLQDSASPVQDSEPQESVVDPGPQVNLEETLTPTQEVSNDPLASLLAGLPESEVVRDFFA